MTRPRKPVDEPVRERIRHDLDATLMVDAGAGTGKTTLLLDRLLNLILTRGVSLARVAAVTFTEKAAGELLERLRKALRERAKERDADPGIFNRLFEDLDRADIGTFHSFCARVLREYPVEARVDPRFRTLDDVEERLAEVEAWETWLGTTLNAGLEGENQPLARALGLGVTLSQIAEWKDFWLGHQHLIGSFPASPFPEQGPFQSGVEILLKAVETRLSQCKHPESDGFTEAFRGFKQKWDSCARLSGEAFALAVAGCEVPNLDRKGRVGDWKGKALIAVRADFQRLQPLFEKYSGEVGDWVCAGLRTWLGGYLAAWRKARDDQGVLSFDDLLGKTRDLLRDHPGARRVLREKWDRFFVDEFQDTDPLQAEILFYLCSKDGGGKEPSDWKDLELEPGKLFLVGDPQQSIYRFRRADVDLYHEVKKRVAASPGGRVEALRQNFRSLEPIVSFVGSRFSPLWASEDFEAQAAARVEGVKSGGLPPLVGLRVASPEPGEKWGADVKRLAEARAVAAYLRNILARESPVLQDPRSPGVARKVRPGDVAILLRDVSNHEEPYLEALREMDLPFQLVKGRRFYSRPEVTSLVVLLTALESPAEAARVVAALRSMVFGFTDEELFLYRSGGGEFRYLSETPGGTESLDRLGKAFALLRELHERSRRLPLPEMLQAVFESTGLLPVLWAQPQGDQRAANLLKLSQMARDLDAERHLGFGAFVRWIHRQMEDEVSEGEASPGDAHEDRLTLMTVHQAKGLEFPIVVVAGSTADKARKPHGFFFNREEGRVEWSAGNLTTSRYSEEQERETVRQNAEGLRLLYVAATRAKDCLVLPYASWTEEKKFLHPLAPAPGPEGPALVPGMEIVPLESNDAARAIPEGGAPRRRSQEETPEIRRRAEEVEKHFKVRAERLQARIRPIQRIRASDMENDGFPDAKRRSPEKREMGGKALGTLAHRLLEKAWEWKIPSLEKAARAWGANAGLGSEEAAEAMEWVKKALASDLGKRIARSRQVHREAPACLMRGNILREGVMDVVFEEDGGWTLVDFKTDATAEERLEGYEAQLRFYSDLLEQTTPLPVKKALLWFVRLGRVVSVDLKRP